MCEVHTFFRGDFLSEKKIIHYGRARIDITFDLIQTETNHNSSLGTIDYTLVSIPTKKLLQRFDEVTLYQLNEWFRFLRKSIFINHSDNSCNIFVQIYKIGFSIISAFQDCLNYMNYL